ncbi:MAG TPA: hypothetical protein VGR84_15440 [Candidatus Acidoferrales bacterium]|nr:hypothetical protein [Candidatus Acidoferrales bacterium]
MLLAPGPIPAITSNWYDATVEVPGFVALVQAWDPLFNKIEVELDAAIDPTAAIDALAVPASFDTDTLDTEAALAALGETDTSVDQQTGDAQMGALTPQLVTAYSVTPSEAFETVPINLLPGPAGPGTPVPSTSTVQINNLTRPGDSNFYPGDDYEIVVQLQPSPGGGGAYQFVGVTLWTIQDGTTWPTICLGITDANGTLKNQGTFAPGDVGNWQGVIQPGTPATPATEQGGILPGENAGFNWTVSNAPGSSSSTTGPATLTVGGLHLTLTQGEPCPTSGVTVTLDNLTNPGNTNFFSGDYWLLTVTGAPNSPVQIWALQNDQPLGTEILGNTDGNGLFTLQGQMADQYIGSWVENYAVGSDYWPQSLTFYVSAAFTPPSPSIVPGSTPPTPGGSTPGGSTPPPPTPGGSTPGAPVTVVLTPTGTAGTTA